MRFSDTPVNSAAADHLARKLITDIGAGPGDWTEEEIRRMVDEGCAAAVTIIRSLDGPLESAKSKFSEHQQQVVEMVAIVMTLKTLDRAVELMMLESFLGMLGIKPPK